MDNQDQIREQIQAYLLGTLSDRDHALVEASIERHESWQRVLEEETYALTQLDSLEPEEPPMGLAERTMGRIDTEEPRVIHSTSRIWQWLSGIAVIFIVGAFILIGVLPPAREAARRASTETNMKQLGLVFKMYANESQGSVYPALSPYENLWMFDIESVYPEYINDLGILVSPNLPEYDELADEMSLLAASNTKDWRRITEIAAEGFVYVGWNFKNEDELAMLVQERQMLAKAEVNGELQMESGDNVYRLREDIERFLITDINNPAGSANAQSTVPIFFESLNAIQSRKSNRGSNVLYLDGHVELHEPNSHLLSIPSTLERFHLEE